MSWMLSATLLVLLVCLARHPIAAKLGLMDMPDGHRKLHGRPVPLVGGLATMMPFSAVLLVSGAIGTVAWQIALGLVGAGLTLLGAWDDRRNIRPLIRLAVSAGLMLPAVLLVPDLQIERLAFLQGGSGLHLAALSIPFTILCLLALQNGLNMADGMNGLAGTLCLSWTLFLAAHALHQPGLFHALLALAAAISVSLVFNMRGKLFFGDAGSYSISVMIGFAAIYLYNSPASHLTLEEILLVFAVPMIDMGRLVVTRLQAGVSPLRGDRNHLHHLLMDRFGPHQALLIYAGLACAPLLVAFAFPGTALLLLPGTALAYLLLVVGCQARRLAESAT